MQESNYIHSKTKQKNYNKKPVVISYEEAVNARKKTSETKIGPKVANKKKKTSTELFNLITGVK